MTLQFSVAGRSIAEGPLCSPEAKVALHVAVCWVPGCSRMATGGGVGVWGHLLGTAHCR